MTGWPSSNDEQHCQLCPEHGKMVALYTSTLSAVKDQRKIVDKIWEVIEKNRDAVDGLATALSFIQGGAAAQDAGNAKLERASKDTWDKVLVAVKTTMYGIFGIIAVVFAIVRLAAS